MEWISQNWVWVLFAVGMIAMHLFGHGGHGGHDGGQTDSKPASKDSEQRSSAQHSGHHHYGDMS